ncbi:adrenocortical dysplasia protein homolog [Ctenodactylus gundi]
MAGSGNLVLQPWIRELILGPEALSSPRAGQLLKDVETPGPSHIPDAGAMLLVSDGTHSIRCLVTHEALDISEWEEKEFGFRGAEGRLLIIQVCGICIQVAEGDAPAEFYLQVDRFNLLPTEQPRLQVTGCNQDLDVQKKLHECLEDHLSESSSSNAGLTLTQLLDEIQEDQEHWGALVHVAESCLMLAGTCTAPSLTHWDASHCRATVSLRLLFNGIRVMGWARTSLRVHVPQEEATYTVSGLLLHISENDQQILNSLCSSQEAQGTTVLPSHEPLEESSASISLLPGLPLAAPDLVQRSSTQPQPAICPSSGSMSPSFPHPSHTPASPHCTSSLSFHGHAPHPHQAHVPRAQKPTLEFRELGLPPDTQQPSPRTRAEGAPETFPVWDPTKRHRDGSVFQYEYDPPCTSLCAQVQAARLPPQLVAWALQFLVETESELT